MPPEGQVRCWGKPFPPVLLWAREMEKLLILKSKCQRLGKDFEVLKINIGKGRRKEGEKGGRAGRREIPAS